MLWIVLLLVIAVAGGTWIRAAAEKAREEMKSEDRGPEDPRTGS